MIRVTKIQIPGLETRKPRRLYVCTPKDYETSGRRYPVLYMFDGHNVFYDRHATYGKSWGMREYLAKAKLPLILVAVECNPEGNRRLNEYTPWAFNRRGVGRIEALGRTTMDWITGQLKPEIDRAYRTLPDRDHTLIAGSSMGGLMSLYAVLADNDVFSRAAVISPSLWVDRQKMNRLIADTPLQQPTRIYMDCGTGECTEGERAGMLNTLFDTARRLTKAGCEVAVRTVPGARHCEADWEKRIPVWMDYLMPETAEEIE